jgi:hypothetical protein
MAHGSWYFRIFTVSFRKIVDWGFLNVSFINSLSPEPRTLKIYYAVAGVVTCNPSRIQGFKSSAVQRISIANADKNL